MRYPSYGPIVALMVLVMASLACLINLGGPETPEATIPVSTEAVESLDEVVAGSQSSADEGGQITIVLNESQVTSYLALKLQEMEDPIIQDPQVYLRDGQIQVYGTVQRSGFQVTARIVLTAEVDEDGTPRLQLVSVDFGPFPVPDGLLDGFSAMLDEAFTGSIGPVATGFRIESILIEGGLVAITGRMR